MQKKGLIFIGAVISPFILTGCGGSSSRMIEKFTTQKVEMPTICEGWEKIELKGRTRYALAKDDQGLLVNIEAHNLRGRNLGCWE